MSKNRWIQHLANISLPWWSTPCMIHSFTLTIAQIIGYVCKSESTSIHVDRINVKSEINVLHIKSPFRSSEECNLYNSVEAKMPPSLILWRPYECIISHILEIKGASVKLI
jgi:hypothetical protein